MTKVAITWFFNATATSLAHHKKYDPIKDGYCSSAWSGNRRYHDRWLVAFEHNSVPKTGSEEAKSAAIKYGVSITGTPERGGAV